MNVLAQGTLTKFQSLSDKGIKIEFVTREADPELSANCQALHQQDAILYITTGDLKTEQKQELDSQKVSEFSGIKPKTKSQELRNVLYVLWEQSDQTKDKEQLYNEWMDKFKNHIKEMLD